MARDRTVTVKYKPPETDQPVLDMANIRIEIDEDHPEAVWIWMIENGIKVEGGQFSLDEFMSVILDYYNRNY
jgi:hypothetical protein